MYYTTPCHSLFQCNALPYWSTSHPVASCLKYNIIHCTALYHNVLHFSALLCIDLHCITLHCSTLHSIWLHCNVMYCTTCNCTTLHCTALHWGNGWMDKSISNKVSSKCPVIRVDIFTIQYQIISCVIRLDIDSWQFLLIIYYTLIIIEYITFESDILEINSFRMTL